MTTRTQGADDLVRLLAQLVAPHLRECLPSSADAVPAYYDQGNSPLGRRQHLDLVRRGVLVGHKTGRKVLVRRIDVDTCLAERKSGRRGTDPNAHDVLSDWDLERRGSK